MDLRQRVSLDRELNPILRATAMEECRKTIGVEQIHCAFLQIDLAHHGRCCGDMSVDIGFVFDVAICLVTPGSAGSTNAATTDASLPPWFSQLKAELLYGVDDIVEKKMGAVRSDIQHIKDKVAEIDPLKVEMEQMREAVKQCAQKSDQALNQAVEAHTVANDALKMVEAGSTSQHAVQTAAAQHCLEGWKT